MDDELNIINNNFSDEVFEDVMENPNLFIQLSSSGGIWSALTITWQETMPWTLNAPN